jgi:very-short-patch-repair endonuclease
MAAVLACGPNALLSHRSAGALYGLIRHDGPVDVTAPTKHRHPGIVLHRSHDAERTVYYGIPVTTPARTIIDLADALDITTLTRAANEARLRHLLTDEALTEAIENAPGRRTNGLLPTYAPTRSAFEDTFLRFIDRYDLPRPEVNVQLHGYEVDILFRAQRLVVELDGRNHERRFEADREKDAHLLAHGFATLRITYARLTRAATREAKRLHALLAEAKD